jgi:hypothetical protein
MPTNSFPRTLVLVECADFGVPLVTPDLGSALSGASRRLVTQDEASAQLNRMPSFSAPALLSFTTLLLQYEHFEGHVIQVLNLHHNTNIQYIVIEGQRFSGGNISPVFIHSRRTRSPKSIEFNRKGYQTQHTPHSPTNRNTG